MPRMISVAEAERLIAESLRSFPSEDCPLPGAAGRILREAVRADRDLPPFDRVMMDGIAIASAARRSFAIERTLQPGEEPGALADRAGGCIQVMTGAALPAGCDAVVPYEDIDISGATAALRAGIEVKAGQYVHRKGADCRAGDVLLEPGCLLGPPQMAIIASAGKAVVRATRPPSIAVISNGNELVDLGRPVGPHQIRPVNTYGLRAALNLGGFPEVTCSLTRDEPGEIEACLRDALARAEVVVVTGGVSMGKHDYLPSVLERIGVKPIFHKVRQRPGKPLWFGLACDGRPVFALPGNPVAAMVCCRRYVLPQLRRAMGLREVEPEFAELAGEVRFEPPLTYFPPVRVSCAPDARWTATPVRFNNSGDYAALGASDGFVELEAARDFFPVGTVVRLWRWS